MLSTSERGASALVVAGSLVLIMGIAAVTIDVGANFNNRRGSQTAADTAAMAGALSFEEPVEAVTEVLTFARSNLDVTYSNADWATLWTSCTDSDRPANFFPMPRPAGWGGGTVDCISQSVNEIRVRIPDQLIDTSFGQVLGVAEMRANAAAVATLRPRVGSGLLPFAVRGGETSGEICLQTSSGGTAVPPCDGPAQGSFGTVISPWFGNDELGTTPRCNSLSALIDDNIARGLDHFVGVYENPGWSYPQTGTVPANNTTRASDANVDECSVSGGVAVASDGVPIDTLLVDTGNVANAVTAGLATGGGGSYTPLLQQAGPFRQVRSGSATLQLNNVPLWNHLLPGNAGGIAACNSASISSLPTIDQKNTAMNACLAAAASSGNVIFRDTIENSPRFAWAPQMWFTSLGSGQRFNPVYQYRQVYLAGSFMNCSGTTCGIVFYPGDGSSPLCDAQGPNCRTITINQQTAFLIPTTATSNAVRNSFPGGNLGPFEPELLR
jgi:hypothetical protein